MDNCQTLFLTKEQCKKKGNGITLTQDQLAWLRGVVTPSTISTTEEQVHKEPVKPKRDNSLYTTCKISIKKELLAKIRTYCYQHNIPLEIFYEMIIVDSKMLDGIDKIDYKLGRRNIHVIRPVLSDRYKKLYDAMKAMGYMTRKEAAQILGVSESIMTDYLRLGLAHMRKGRFCFYKKEDLDEFMIKMKKKKKIDL